MAKLTAKQQRFAEEYLIDLNGTQAAIRAGYSPQTANEQGSQLLAKLNIRAYVDKAIAEQSKRTGINADRVIKELARIALVNPADVINLKNATVRDGANKDDTASIASVKVKYFDGEISEREIKIADKIKALELLGKHLGMFKDNINITGNLGVKIIDDIETGEGSGS